MLGPNLPSSARAARADFAAWLNHPGPGSPGADITVSLAGVDGVSADSFAALPPDGVELIRPGVLRVRDELTAGAPPGRARLAKEAASNDTDDVDLPPDLFAQVQAEA